MAKILGVRLPRREETAQKFQEILSKYGCNIKTRIGLHNVTDGMCSPDGIILLEVIGDDVILENLSTELKSFENVKLEVMSL